MPFSESKEGIIRYSQGQKWSEIGPWLVNVISGDGIGLPGVRMAALLADAFNSKTAACWRTNGRMAATMGVSPSAVIEGLRQLERNRHILSTIEPRSGKSMRHIYPKWNEGTARREFRAPHGGVPKGTKPKTGPAAAVGEAIAVPKAAPTSTYEPARRAEDHGQKSDTRRSTSPDPDSLVVQLSEGGMPGRVPGGGVARRYRESPPARPSQRCSRRDLSRGGHRRLPGRVGLRAPTSNARDPR